MNKLNFCDISFHDSRVYALAFDEETFELLLDIDLVMQRISPSKNNKYELNIISATLVFSNVWGLEIDISTSFGLVINNIDKSNPETPRNVEYLKKGSLEYDWHIDLMQGDITFKGVGMAIYKRSYNQKEE